MSGRAAGWAAALVVVAVAVVAGCTSTSEGSPRAAEASSTSGGATEPSTTTTPTTSEFPPPPEELPLDDVNPCDLWTKDQLREFKVDPEPTGDDPSPNGFGGQGCLYFGPLDVDPQLAYSVNTYPETGLADAADSAGPGRTVVAVEVAGFPAVQSQMSQGDRICDVLVGTATGQHMRISVTVTPHDLPIDEFCELSMAAAAAAVENLKEQG